MNLCSASDASSTIFFLQKLGTLVLPNPRDQAFFFFIFTHYNCNFFMANDHFLAMKLVIFIVNKFHLMEDSIQVFFFLYLVKKKKLD